MDERTAKALEIALKFTELLEAIEKIKPGDRSAFDRGMAIAKTEVEKAMAVFLYYSTPESGA